MTQMRRQHRNLGATAGGGNGGSFAPHHRSIFAPPPPPQPPRDPDVEVQRAWNDTPRDFLPDEPPAGLTDDDWGHYVRWRKQLRTDLIPQHKQTQRAPYGLRQAWDGRAQESLRKLHSMMGEVPVSDPSWLRARDEAIRDSAKAADPGCTGITITRRGDEYAAVLHGSIRDTRFRATPAQNSLSRRVTQAIAAAGHDGLPWVDSPDGARATVELP